MPKSPFIFLDNDATPVGVIPDFSMRTPLAGPKTIVL